MKKIVSLLAIILSLTSCSDNNKIQSSPIPVTSNIAISKDIPITLTYTGHMVASKNVEIRPQISGTLLERLFNPGDEVKKDQPLFKIDPRPFETKLKQAEAALAESLANLRCSQETAKRYEQLLEEDYVSKTDYEQFLASVMSDEAKVKQNQAQVDTEKLNIEFCNIKAPFDGITGQQTIDLGNFVNMGNATPIITITQINPILLNFYIPEKDLTLIQSVYKPETLPVFAFLNGNLARGFEGKLILINNQIDEKTKTLLLQALFNNEDHSLWPGQFVDVKLQIATEKDAVVIDAKAIRTDGQENYVFIVKDNQIEKRYVTLGASFENLIIIKKGLKPGERVVIDSNPNLYDGCKVNIEGGTY